MPLSKNPKYIALIEYLRSYDSIEYELNRLFLEVDSNNLLSFTKNNNANLFDLHIEDSFEFVKNDLKEDFKEICLYLANRHYIVDDNHTIYIKEAHFYELKQLQSQIDNFLIESFFLTQSVQHCKDFNKSIYLANEIEREKFIRNSIYNEIETFTDLHIHLGSSLNIEYRIDDIIKAPDKIDTKEIPADLFMKLTDCKVEIKNIFILISLLEKSLIYKREELGIILNLIKNKEFVLLNNKQKESLSIREHSCFNIIKFDDFLLENAKEAFKAQNIVVGDRFLILYFTKILFYSSDECLKSGIKIYFILRNIIKTFLVQQHRRSGFGYFSTYSRSTLRRSKSESEKINIIKSLFSHDKNINIEARITPKSSAEAIAKDLAGYIREFEAIKEPFNKNKELAKYLLDNSEDIENIKKFLNKQNFKDKNLKFIFHFQKEKDEDCTTNYNEFKCIKFDKLRKRIKKEAIALAEFVSDLRYQNYFCNYSCLNGEIRRNLSQYFGGIDSASKEYYTPPEVFAPIFRYFKSTPKISKSYRKNEIPLIEKKVNKPRFTYHVGEDFRDIISGLRAIFEAVLFLNFKTNDRLGHALALGLDCGLFYKNVKKIVLTKQEYLDNLIFIYYILILFQNSDFTKELEQIKDKFEEVSKDIYFDLDGNFTIDDFLDSWLLRRNCPIEFDSMMKKFDLRDYKSIEHIREFIFFDDRSYITSALPDFFNLEVNEFDVFESRYFRVRNNKKAYELFKAYSYDKKIQSKGREFYKNEIITFPQVATYIQNVLLQNLILKRNIAIEVMPTSNILISHISNLKEHPMLKLKPIDKKSKLNLYICSDNPMIQNTNIFKEYDFVYSFLKQEFNDEIAKKYLKKISKASKEEFVQ